MKSISNLTKMLLVLCTAFYVPRGYMHGNEDFAALKNWLLPGRSNPTSGQVSQSMPSAPLTPQTPPPETTEQPMVITLESIQHKDDASLPLPEEIQRTKPVPLTELLRFDYVPHDVVQRWPYVTAVNPELHVQAYRAPFFTGTTPDDLEGVVTYYFDSRNNTTQIMVKAKTGDFRPLVVWLKTYYGFEYRETQSPVVYVYEPPQRWPSKSGSYLWIRPAHAFADGYDYKRFDVTLVLNRPKE